MDFTITKLTEVSGSDEEAAATLKEEFKDVITSGRNQFAACHQQTLIGSLIKS